MEIVNWKRGLDRMLSCKLKHNSAMHTFRNNPIYFADPMGDWPKWLGGKGSKRSALKSAGKYQAKHGGDILHSKKHGYVSVDKQTSEGVGVEAKVFAYDKPITMADVGNFLSRIGSFFTGGIQGYGDASSSDESLARQGNKNDPFNASVDFSEVSEMMALIKARYKNSPKSVRNAAREKFKNTKQEFKKQYNSSSKLTKKMFKVILSEDVLNASNDVSEQVHRGNPNEKVKNIEENANNQYVFDKDGELVGTYKGKKAFFVTGGSPEDTLYRREWIQDTWSSNPSDSTKGVYIKY